jgi:anti-sigma factor RsiW
MNCTLALRMLDAYVDGELDATTAADVQEHLAACPACLAAHRQHLGMRSALQAASLRHAAPPALRQSILRAIDRAERPMRSPRAMLPWWQALALGASMAALGTLGGWWFARLPALESLPDLAVAQHVAALTPAGPRIDVASSDRHVVRPWFQGRLEFAPMVRDLSGQGFDLVGARVEHVGGRQAVAVVYRLHTHVIDVFSWRARGQFPEAGRAVTIRGFNVIAWSDRDMDFAAVSDTDSGELTRFVTAYRAPP